MGGTSLGFGALMSVLSGLRGFHGRLAIATGPNIPPALVEEAVNRRRLRSTAEVEVFQFADESIEYMKASDLAIIHGGHTTLMEGILCGTPVIIAATQREQEKNAERVRTLGVGHVLSSERHLDEQVAELVPRCLADESLRARAEQVARGLRTQGTEVLADYLDTQVFPVFARGHR
jgi:UDP:flavonoid glycosyltransferase YjiC (YdhE family)